MKLLVATLKTIEQEFEMCCESIKSQEYSNYDHIVIENMRKAEAHDKLYGMFQNSSDQYDLLIKIDADMVIDDINLFKKVVEEFVENERLDHLIVPVYDHFIKMNIDGVNVYRNTVKWQPNEDNYYTDRGQVDNTIMDCKRWTVNESMPIIHHCPNPSSFQSFHYGMHRAIKAFQFKKRGEFYKGAKHWGGFGHIKDNYINTKYRSFLLVLAAARYVIDEKLDGTYIDYDNEKTIEIFKYINAKCDKELYTYSIDNAYIKMTDVMGLYSYYIILLGKNPYAFINLSKQFMILVWHKLADSAKTLLPKNKFL